MSLPFWLWVRVAVGSFILFSAGIYISCWFLMNHLLSSTIPDPPRRYVAASFLMMVFGIIPLAVVTGCVALGIRFHDDVGIYINWGSGPYKRAWKFGRQQYLYMTNGNAQPSDVYRPLDVSTREIRLVSLEPGSGHDNISCQIFYTRLGRQQDVLEYEALSYTWGQMHSLRSITLNGSPFVVTKNLEAALRQLRLTQKARVIWVDALCIDQANFQERGQQVQLMREIYKNAAAVLVWLGVKCSTSDCAMDFLTTASRQENPRAWLLQTVVDGGKASRQQWEAVILLFRREYWSRAWIIQEIGMASKLQLLCGSKVIPWEVAVLCQSVWAAVRESSTSQALRKSLSDLIEKTNAETAMELVGFGTNDADRDVSLLSLQTTRDAVLRNVQPKTLVELLQAHRLALATDRRDKIYALAGLARDCQTPPLPINYSLSPWETCLQTLEFLLETTGCLDFLALSGAPEIYIFKPPSWTPDFYSVSISRFIPEHSRKIYHTGFTSYNASGSRRATPVSKFLTSYQRFCRGLFNLRCTTLQVEGCVVGTISAHWTFGRRYGLLGLPRKQKPGMSRLQHGPDKDLVDEIRQFYDAFIKHPLLETYTQEERTKAIWRTLTYNQTAEGETAPQEWSSLFSVIINGPSSVPSSFINAHSAGLDEISSDDKTLAFIEPFLNSVRRFGLGRRYFYITDKGRLGSAFDFVKPGAKFCIVPGCRMPIIITPSQNPTQDDRFAATTCGGAYLDGYMHGEAMEELGDGLLSLETFNLH